MQTAALSGALALVLALALTPGAGAVGRRLRILAQPGPLSLHDKPIPRTGGMAVFLAVSMSITITSLVLLDVSSLAFSVLLCAGLIYLIGLMDDARNLSPGLRLLLEAGVSLLAFALGVRIEGALYWALPLTVVVLVGASNAFNLLDGMDGLAAGVASIAGVFLGILGWLQGADLVALVGLVVAGACLGFLPFNIRRARLFLGDGGSLLLGFTLGATAVMLTAGPAPLQWFIGAGLMLGLPALDLFFAIMRRLRRWGWRRVLEGDREHIYDLVHRQGLSVGKVLFVMYSVAVLFGLSGLVASSSLVLGMALSVVEVSLFSLAALRLTSTLRRTRHV